jgi:hypothetical protein
MQAAQRRLVRDAQKRHREFERQAKERAKLSVAEQAKLEVDIYENRLDVLSSVHKEQGEIWDWVALAVSLPPPFPQKNSNHELRTKQLMLVSNSREKDGLESAIEQARLQDEQELKDAIQHYNTEKGEHEKMRNLALRILAKDHKAYMEALVEFSPLRELSDLGSLLHFTVRTATLIECEMKVNSTQTIPNEVKTLTSGGKLSIKPMPKGRFHEIYRDYVCGCVLRVAREVFAMLPIEDMLITASVDSLNPTTGHTDELKVLSVVLPRVVMKQLEFEHLKPFDAMGNFQIRGNFQPLRKSDLFQPINPLTFADIIHSDARCLGLRDLFEKVQKMREEMTHQIAGLSRGADDSLLQTGISP